ncbi:hypothetical protein D3C80_1528650 [compost metagenome]
MQGGADLADRGVDLVHARCDQAQVLQRGDQADGAVAAHVQVAGVVEENHPAGGVGRHRWAVQRADQHIVATWLQQAGAAPLVVQLAQFVALLGHAAPLQFRKAFHHQAGRFSAGMRVDDVNLFHGLVPCVKDQEATAAGRPV